MTNYVGPSPAQQKTLDDIKTFIAQHGFSPTVMELSQMAGIANNAVGQRIDALVRKGCVTRRRGASRSLMPANMDLVKTSSKQRHPLYLTSDQLLLLYNRINSSERKDTPELDELVMLIESVHQAACNTESQSTA